MATTVGRWRKPSAIDATGRNARKDYSSFNLALADILAEQHPHFDRDLALGCFYHVLNLAAQAALAFLRAPIDGIKKLVMFVKRCEAKSERLMEFCQIMDHPLYWITPILDVSTRWNKTCLSVLSSFETPCT